MLPCNTFIGVFETKSIIKTFTIAESLVLYNSYVDFSDLSVGLFSVVPDIAWKFAVTWEAGLVACKLIK